MLTPAEKRARGFEPCTRSPLADVLLKRMTEAALAAGPEVANATLIRARAGDAAAFADIVSRHQGMVFSIAYRFFNDRPTAEDLAQEVFLRLFRNLASIDSVAHLTYWLRRVTSHCCIDWRRRQARVDEVAFEDVNEIDDLPAVSMAPFSRDVLLEERLRRCVRELPERARLVVTLRYQEDLEPAEIAEILDMPVNTVKSHLHRSLERLREWLQYSEGRR